MGDEPRAVMALAAVYLVWGSTYLAIRVALVDFPPLLLSGLRYTVVGTVLLAALAAGGARMPDRRQWAYAVPIGVFLFLCGNGFVALAERRIGSGIAAVVLATVPLWMALLAAAGGERPALREWIGVALGIGAMATLGAGADLRADLGSTILLLGSPLGWAIGSTISRRAPREPGGLLASSAAQQLAGGLVAMAIGLALGERYPAAPGLRSNLAMLYLIVFGSFIGFTAYTWLLRHTTPVLATSYAFVNPILAVLLGWALAGESLTWQTAVATPIVVTAVVLAVTGRLRAARRGATPAAVVTSSAAARTGRR